MIRKRGKFFEFEFMKAASASLERSMARRETLLSEVRAKPKTVSLPSETRCE